MFYHPFSLLIWLRKKDRLGWNVMWLRKFPSLTWYTMHHFEVQVQKLSSNVRNIHAWPFRPSKPELKDKAKHFLKISTCDCRSLPWAWAIIIPPRRIIEGTSFRSQGHYPNLWEDILIIFVFFSTLWIYFGSRTSHVVDTKVTHVARVPIIGSRSKRAVGSCTSKIQNSNLERFIPIYDWPSPKIVSNNWQNGNV